MSSAPRSVRVFRGDPRETAEVAAGLVADLDPARVVWLGEGAPSGVRTVGPGAVASLLGETVHAVIIDTHGGLHADVLGAAVGLVVAGGVVVLRRPHRSQTAFERRVEESVGASLEGSIDPVEPVGGSVEQAAVVAALGAALAEGSEVVQVLVARRGRGKSTALGLALAQAGVEAVVTGPSRAAVSVVLERAGGSARFVPVEAVLAEGGSHEACLVIDEAAQLPVPVLQALAGRWGGPILLATTADGYEGTGGGFRLRFLPWLESRRGVVEHALTQPIRWASDDPVEAWTSELLLLAVPLPPAPHGEVVSLTLSQARLATDEAALRQVFALLVQAHYRTTPGDLQRLLDDPALRLHALAIDGQIVAVNLVCVEGGLSPEQASAVASGRRRLRGQALADTLTVHGGQDRAAELTMIRSVRLAVHPDLRRRGLARQLVAAVHAHYDVDLFGTLFAGSPEVVRLREGLGYEAVRLAVRRSARHGQPSVVMVRPVIEAAQTLVRRMRLELARDLAVLHPRLDRAAAIPVDPALMVQLRRGLPRPVPRTPAERWKAIRGYTHGPRTLDTVIGAVRGWLVDDEGVVDQLESRVAALARLRILDDVPWVEAAEEAGFEGVRPAMRALRRGLAAVVEVTEASRPAR